MAQWVLYDSFREFIGDGTIDLDDDVFKMDLVGAGYTPVLSHTQLSDLGANILSGSGYATQTLTGVAWTRTGADVDWTADDVTFAAAGGSLAPRYAVLWDETALNNELVGYLDLGGVITMADGQRLRLDLSEVVT